MEIFDCRIKRRPPRAATRTPPKVKNLGTQGVKSTLWTPRGLSRGPQARSDKTETLHGAREFCMPITPTRFHTEGYGPKIDTRAQCTDKRLLIL